LGLDLQPDELTAGLAGHCQPDKILRNMFTGESQVTMGFVTPDLCSATFMLHCELEVGCVRWRSIRSCCQFSFRCIWALQRRTLSNTLFASSDLV